MDPKAKQLLDFISWHESRGNYNAIYGNRQNRLDKPITQMSLRELLEHQKAWGRQWGSSAAGRYQIIRPTLEGLIGKLNLSRTMKFDEKTQDYLGLTLLRGRNWDGFISGRLPLEQFALNLAKEWASLPVLTFSRGAHRDVRRGESYYAGDGLNKALVDPDDFEVMLMKLQAPIDDDIIIPPRTPLPPVDTEGKGNWWVVLAFLVVIAIIGVVLYMFVL